MKNALKYTLKKYASYWPYTTLAVLISLIVRHVIIGKDFQIAMIIKGVLEGLTIIRGDSNVGVLWYLTTMLPLTPVLYVIAKKTPIKVYGSLAAIAVLGWYFVLGRFSDVFAPLNYIRAVAGLSLGVITYGFKDALQKVFPRESKHEVFASIIMFVCLILPIIMTFFNITANRLYIVFFVVGFAFCFSNSTKKIPESKVSVFCKKFSLVLYIVHLNMADLISYVSRIHIELNALEQYILYFALTIIGMFVLEGLVRLVKQINILTLSHSL